MCFTRRYIAVDVYGSNSQIFDGHFRIIFIYEKKLVSYCWKRKIHCLYRIRTGMFVYRVSQKSTPRNQLFCFTLATPISPYLLLPKVHDHGRPEQRSCLSYTTPEPRCENVLRGSSAMIANSFPSLEWRSDHSLL